MGPFFVTTVEVKERDHADLNQPKAISDSVIHLEATIVGFHMTPLKFKLQNYRSHWDFTIMMY